MNRLKEFGWRRLHRRAVQRMPFNAGTPRKKMAQIAIERGAASTG